MLQITLLNDARAATFKMEGKLTHEWVAEAEKSWVAFSCISKKQRVVVDLCGVSFVDDHGRELLARMHSSGAKLIGTGPMTSALIEEICRGKQSPCRKWIRTALSLFLVLLLAGAMPGNKNPFNLSADSGFGGRPLSNSGAYSTDTPRGTAHSLFQAIRVARALPGKDSPDDLPTTIHFLSLLQHRGQGTGTGA